MSVFFDNSSGTNDQVGPFICFVSNSSNTNAGDPNAVFETINPSYDSSKRLTVLYTSNFTGSKINASQPNVYNLQAENSTVIHNPPGENEFIITNSPANNFINILPSSSNFIISNLTIEVETHSGSGTQYGLGGSTKIERTTNILHGNSGSEVNPFKNLGYPDTDDRNQLVSARVLASIQEPVGIGHSTTTIKIGGGNNTQDIIFNTGSSNTDVLPSIIPPTLGVGLLSHYTSSWFPLHFSASGNFEEGAILAGTEFSSKLDSEPYTTPELNNEGEAGGFFLGSPVSDYIKFIPEIAATTGGGGTLFRSIRSNTSIRKK